jgi:hypothetical protein
MCGACGVLQGGPEWLECVELNAPRIAERQKRLGLVNKMLAASGVKVTESGGKLILRSMTGATRVVDDLAHVWRAVDEIGRRPADPLSGFVMERRGRGT